MSYLDAIEDADTRGAMQDTLNKSLAQAEANVTQEITELLTKTARLVSWRFIGVPAATMRSGSLQVTSTSLFEVVSDSVSFGKPLEALMEAYQHSDCPLVAALRSAIAADYVRRNVGDIAEASL